MFLKNFMIQFGHTAGMWPQTCDKYWQCPCGSASTDSSLFEGWSWSAPIGCKSFNKLAGQSVSTSSPNAMKCVIDVITKDINSFFCKKNYSNLLFPRLGHYSSDKFMRYIYYGIVYIQIIYTVCFISIYHCSFLYSARYLFQFRCTLHCHSWPAVGVWLHE